MQHDRERKLKPGDLVQVPDGRWGTLLVFRDDKAVVQFLVSAVYEKEGFKLSDLENVKRPTERFWERNERR